MKIYLDDQDYLEVKTNLLGELVLSIRAKKDEHNFVLVTATLNAEELEDLINNLIAMRAKVK